MDKLLRARVAQVRAAVPPAELDDWHAAEDYARGYLDNCAENVARGDYSAAWLAAVGAARVVAHLDSVAPLLSELVGELRPLAQLAWDAQEVVA